MCIRDSCGYGDLVAGLADGDLAAIGQGADDFEQLPGRDGGFPILRVFDGDAGDHFHFQIRAGQRQQTALHLHQEIGQYRQGLSALDHVDDLGQRLQECFAVQTETHIDGRPYALALRKILNQKLVVMVSAISVENLRNHLKIKTLLHLAKSV